jgi:hypothetical protein
MIDIKNLENKDKYQKNKMKNSLSNSFKEMTNDEMKKLVKKR